MATERARAVRGAWRGWSVALVVVLLMVGCGYSREEPGLFRPPRTAPSSVPTTAEGDRLPEPTNRSLPVLGEQVWTTGEGLALTIRFAVHAIRRIDKATILDWSVTPLPSARLVVGTTIPGSVDLGLGREDDGDQRIYLIDASGQVFRPLAHKRPEVFRHCLCTPLWLAQLQLRVGETRMLQTAFAPLPTAVDHVDVSLANTMPFWNVPVMAEGTVPLARRSVDLARRAEAAPALSDARTFTDAMTGLRRAITLLDLQTGPSGTTLTWSLTSVDDQPHPAFRSAGPPISANYGATARLRSVNVASGPQLDVPGQAALRAKWLTTAEPARGYVECLCSHFDLWAAGLRTAGGEVMLATTYGLLPVGTKSVDVVLPRLGTIRDVPVRSAGVDADDAVLGVGRVIVDSWTYSTASPPGAWVTTDWPTPPPDPGQLKDYRARVDRIVDLPAD